MAAPLPLAEARALADQREWRALAELGVAMPASRMEAEPEVAALVADAARRIGRAAEALAICEALESVVRRTGRHHLTLDTTNIAGMALFESGQMEAAESRFQQLLEDATSWSDPSYAAKAANNLGVIANIRGQRDAALGWYQRALAAYRELGDTRGLAQSHHNLAISYRDLGFASEADAHHRRAAELAVRDGSDDVAALAMLGRAELRLRAGDGPLADALARRAALTFRRLADPLGRADATRIRGAAACLMGRHRAAGRALEAALRVASAHDDLLLLAETLRDLGLLRREEGDLHAASRALRESADAFGRIGAAAEAAAVRDIARRMSNLPPDSP